VTGAWASLFAALALLAAPAPALAHSKETVRRLRLQVDGKKIEGVVMLSMPPGKEAQLLLAVPPGLVAGEKPEQSPTEVLGRRVAAEALRGVHTALGADEMSLRTVPLEVVEAKVRRTPTGGLEAVAIVRLSAELPREGILELAASSGPALRATLGAAEGTLLTLLVGTGRQVPGGLALRPRPARPCRVRIARQ
jgi:hypothetical protein